MLAWDSVSISFIIRGASRVKIDEVNFLVGLLTWCVKRKLMWSANVEKRNEDCTKKRTIFIVDLLFFIVYSNTCCDIDSCEA